MNTPPIDLSALATRPASFRGRPVAELVITLQDGTVHRVALPAVLASARLSTTGEKILDVICGAENPLTRKQVAMRLGRKTAKGSLGQIIRHLILSGDLVEFDGDLSPGHPRTPDTLEAGQLSRVDSMCRPPRGYDHVQADHRSPHADDAQDPNPETG